VLLAVTAGLGTAWLFSEWRLLGRFPLFCLNSPPSSIIIYKKHGVDLDKLPSIFDSKISIYRNTFFFLLS
jgi:hypothetical protein